MTDARGASCAVWPRPLRRSPPEKPRLRENGETTFDAVDRGPIRANNRKPGGSHLPLPGTTTGKESWATAANLRSQVTEILGGCRRSTPKGLRNYAILLLLARLGLRAKEVGALRLRDGRTSSSLTARGGGLPLGVIGFGALPLAQDRWQPLSPDAEGMAKPLPETEWRSDPLEKRVTDVQGKHCGPARLFPEDPVWDWLPT